MELTVMNDVRHQMIRCQGYQREAARKAGWGQGRVLIIPSRRSKCARDNVELCLLRAQRSLRCRRLNGDVGRDKTANQIRRSPRHQESGISPPPGVRIEHSNGHRLRDRRPEQELGRDSRRQLTFAKDHRGTARTTHNS